MNHAGKRADWDTTSKRHLRLIEIVKVIISDVMARSAAADDTYINDHKRIKRAVIGSINCAEKAQKFDDDTTN
uniref:SFRICE_018162 n=1 Tax=Spodoptera frugiperda TaxID=7108 RepID=A0A2H1VNL4_SPOFR